jgi:DNA-binding response OmpR family regulator
MANILVVDDEEGIRKTLKRILEKEGHFVETADSYKEACERFVERDFDLIIMDIVLPDVSGTELLKFLKEAGYENPIVMITGKPSIETVQEAVRYKAFDYITKPIERREFLEVVNKALEEVERKKEEISQRVAEYLRMREVEKEIEEMKREIEKLKEEVEKKEGYIEKLYETHSFGLMISAEDGKIIDMNRIAKERVGDVVGKNLRDVFGEIVDEFEEEMVTKWKGYDVEFHKIKEGDKSMIMVVIT